MLPAPSYDHIDKILNEETFYVNCGYVKGLPLETRTVGFIVFDQNFGREPVRDLISNLDMLNLRSGTKMHFFLCGVSKYGMNEEGAKALGRIKNVDCYHNARSALSFVTAFEREIPNWNFRPGLDLLLIDVKEHDHRRRLDFSSVIYLRVDEMIKAGLIERPTDLLNKLIEFAREGKVASAADFRNELRGLFGRNWIIGFILAMFPKHFRKLAQAEVVLLGGSSAPN